MITYPTKCKRCGSDNIRKCGHTINRNRKYHKVYCNDCHHYSSNAEQLRDPVPASEKNMRYRAPVTDDSPIHEVFYGDVRCEMSENELRRLYDVTKEKGRIPRYSDINLSDCLRTLVASVTGEC